MSRARSGRARGVLVLGGAVLVAIGIWLGGFFKGPGLGGNGGDGVPGLSTDGDGENGRDDADERDGEALTRDDAVGVGAGESPMPEADDSGEQTGPLHIVLEPEEGYSIAYENPGGKRRYEATTLEGVVATAAATEPGPDGQRVVITSRRLVSGGAHLQLVRRLEEAGLAPEEIVGYQSSDVKQE